jgi:hypothetical protein
MNGNETEKLSSGSNLPTEQIGTILAQAKGWITFVGVIILIYGILTFWTIIGILFIWLGIILIQAGSSASRYTLGNNTADLLETLNKLKSYFKITGILIIINIILYILAIIFFIIAMIAGFQLFDFSQFAH